MALNATLPTRKTIEDSIKEEEDICAYARRLISTGNQLLTESTERLKEKQRQLERLLNETKS